MINKSCLFLHGLESGPRGKKAQYLQKIFSHVCSPDLQTGVLGFRSNSFMMSAIRNMPSLLSGSYTTTVAHDILSGGTQIAISAVKSQPPDIVVGSSMGGAIALEFLRTGEVMAPAVLLAPALGKLLGDEGLERWCDDFTSRAAHDQCPIVVVHSTLDDVVDIKHSRELCGRIGAELVEVEGGDHSLNNFLLDGTIQEDGSPQANNLKHIVDRILS